MGLEDEGGAGRDECGLIVVREIAPQAADHEGPHGDALPERGGGPDPKPKPALDISVVVEREGALPRAAVVADIGGTNARFPARDEAHR